MKKHLFLLVLLWLTACSAFSQDSTQSKLSQDSSIKATLVQGYKYPSLVYSANGQVLERREIMTRLRLYEEPAEELQRSQNARTGMVAWLGVMLGSGIAAASQRDQGNTGAQYTFASIAVGAAVAALLAGARSNRHFGKAIAVYNKRFLP
jgi:hypothetical protein